MSMIVNWTHQIECTRPDLVKPVPATVAEAKNRLKLYISQREARRKSLEDVMNDNGVMFGSSPEGIVAMTKFFLDAVGEKKSDERHSNKFVDLLWNFGQFIGDCAIDQAPLGVNRWKVENVALKGCPPRYIFVVDGYALESQSFDPDGFLARMANAKMAGEVVSDFLVVGKLNYVLDLAKRRIPKLPRK